MTAHSTSPGTRPAAVRQRSPPPPLLLRSGWPAVYLEGGRSTPLGVGVETRFRQATAELEAGDVILLYTDGLVETRTAPLEEGMNRLRERRLDAWPRPRR